MELVRFVAGTVNFLLSLYLLVLLVRLVFEYIPMFNREWRPKGGWLVVAEIVYTITDPPIRFFRRIIPPLRLGPVAIDLGFTLTMLSCFLLMSIMGLVARA